jgi:serine protease Do
LEVTAVLAASPRIFRLATWLFAASALPLSLRGATLDDLQRVQASVQQNYERVRQALVAIECNGGTASGVIVSPAGLVLTAAHVVENAKRKTKITLYDGKTVEGTSLGVDTSTDAAMLQLPAPARAWPYISISREVRELAIGQWCFAMGHPGGWDPARGPVLRTGKIVKLAPNVVQSDCVLMGGDSGGVLCNLAGEVIGINSQIWRGRDQNVHVNMNPFLRSWDALKRGETINKWSQGIGAWIGLRTEPTDGGLRIRAIAADSPAQKLGLKEGDVILRANNKLMRAEEEFSALINARRAGEIVTLKVKTATGEKILEAKVGQRPVDPGPGTFDLGPWKWEIGPWDLAVGPWKVRLGPWSLNFGPMSFDLGPRDPSK